MNTSHRQPIPEPTIGSTIRVCYLASQVSDTSTIGDPCQVVERIGPNTFRLQRNFGRATVDWVERVTSWVNVPQAQEVAS